MAHQPLHPPQLRKTRIVCISDTHNQTPKLPKGDVLIHAGDLTNQGSHSELKKTVEWLEKTDFEAKIVIAGTHYASLRVSLDLTDAGNHDITLDTAFYAEHGSSWKWPSPQDPEECRRLLVNSPSITYLENQAATIYLSLEKGPHTCFKVFGSPFTPKVSNWAFQYEDGEASKLWDGIPLDTDIVVTHTPPKSHCDTATQDDRSGCDILLQALYRVRPMLSVFGHIHEARGVERVRWHLDTPENGCLEEGVVIWRDPGAGTNKQSLVDLTQKGGCPLDNYSALTRIPGFPMQDVGGQPDGGDILQPGIRNSTSCLEDVANSEAKAKAMSEVTIACCQGPRLHSDIGLLSEPDVVSDERRRARRETVMVNAAFRGARSAGPNTFNKPIVVDVDFPVWSFRKHAE